MSAEVKKCAGKVWDGWQNTSCRRKASIDNFCGIHHPDKVKAREDKRNARWEQESKARRELWAQEKKLQDRRDFCEKHFDALEVALRDALQTAHFERHPQRPWHYAASAVLAAIAKERK